MVDFGRNFIATLTVQRYQVVASQTQHDFAIVLNHY